MNVRHYLEENLACFEVERQHIFVSKQINKSSGINLDEMSFKNKFGSKRLKYTTKKRRKHISKPHT